MIEYFGLIKEPKPESFPKVVRQDVMVEVDSMSSLKGATEAHLIHIMRVNMGMMCRVNPEVMLSATFEPDKQFFVPIHMIACITTKTTPLVGSVPDETKKGYVVN
jgi:hypothetical protein